MSDHQVCSRCVMDTTAPGITFDKNGVCSFCHAYDGFMHDIQVNNKFRPEELQQIIQKMRDDSRDNEFDCIVGLSGGLDSSYLCYYMQQMKLRPLLVHVDNGWNSQLAEHNIRCIVEKTGFKFIRETVDFDEFKELQKAYFRASVCDVEVLTDHAMMATLYHNAEKHGIRHVITGDNFATEFTMPRNWNYDKTDIANINDICKKFSTVPIKTFPVYSIFNSKSKYTIITPLNYEKYVKSKAANILYENYGWKQYPYKHYESIFTCFYQAHYLPVKFGFDKRKPHFTDLIHSGQMTRSEAMYDLSRPACDGAALAQMKAFVLNKLGFTEEEWQEIMSAPPVPHTNFETTPAIVQHSVWLKGALKNV